MTSYLVFKEQKARAKGFSGVGDCRQHLYPTFFRTLFSPQKTLEHKRFRVMFCLLQPCQMTTFGGGNRDRTCDLLNANQMLYQLSYAPKQGPKQRDLILNSGI